MRYGVSLSVLVLGTVLGNGALAAVKITSEVVAADGKRSPHTIYLTPDRAKVDSERFGIIIRAETGKLVSLMKDKHEYMEIDLKQVGARMADAQALLQERLKSVPEAQRKQIEAMMAQHGGMPGAQPKQQAVEAIYEKTGQTKTVGSWSCQLFHQKQDGKLLADLCIAPAAAVGLTRDDLAAFRTLAGTMNNSLPEGIRHNAAMMDLDAQTRQIGFEGIPIESIIYLNGKAMTRTVKSVEHAPLPPDTFEVPTGYTRKEMPGFTRPGAASPAN